MVIKRSMACNRMLTPRANKKTPLKNAPNSWDRCQPKESLLGDPGCSENYCSCMNRVRGMIDIMSSGEITFNATSATINPIRSLNWRKTSLDSTGRTQGAGSTYVVKCISNQGQRPCREADLVGASQSGTCDVIVH